MNNGITYYKMKSPYEGDVTKNCALTGPEVDNNFFTLEGRDVKSVTVDGADIVLNLMNGDKLKAEDALDNFIVNIGFDAPKGILRVFYNNGVVEEIKGFCTECEVTGTQAAATDETLRGDGSSKKPLGIADTYKTGQYKPVNKIVFNDGCNCCGCEDMCETLKPKVGDRFITSEQISNYGLVYNYKAVREIACELSRTHSKWRVPTKEDWDDMLNAVEPCKTDRNHNSATPNHYFGEWAGKLLKSTDLWVDANGNCCGGCNNDCEPGLNDAMCTCGKDIVCKPSYCGEYSSCFMKPDSCMPKGIDKFGFRITPAGYADDGQNMLFFGERASFWTATNIECQNIFIKRFEYDKSKVYQDVVSGNNYLSLRLVKDYNGYNYNESEEILGQSYPTVLMPSIKHGSAIWTSVNIFFSNKKCNCNSLTPNYGQNMSFMKKYFIDEWDGHKWLRNEFKEGYSVVVKEALNGEPDVEYRLINGELVNTETKIYDQVNRDLQPTFDEINAKIEANTNEINKTNKALSDFAEETNEAFTTLNNVLTESINSINSAIMTEHDERIAADNALGTRIDTLKSETDTKIEALEQATNEKIETLKTETNERIDTLESDMNEKIDTLRQETTDKFNEVNEELDSHKQDFENFKNATNEAVANLNEGLETERQERIATDEDHQRQLDNKVDWTDVSTASVPRKAIVLKNHDILLGTDTEGNTYNLAMLSKWDVADYGSNKVHMNLNSKDRPTLNDTEQELAYVSDVANVSDAVNEKIDQLATKHDAEVEELKAADSELESRIAEVDGQLLINEGSGFDATEGIITLKSKNGENDIKIQLSGNYGSF